MRLARAAGELGSRARSLPSRNRGEASRDDAMHAGQTCNEEGFRLGHRPSLDGVRGVAVLAVVVGHLLSPFKREGTVWTLQAGGYGVDIFFVLSGFLITTLLIEEHRRHGAIDFRRFFARRALRLIPALFTLLAVASLLNVVKALGLFGNFAGTDWRTILTTLVPIQNWMIIGGHRAKDLQHTWSLAVEDQFYLIWPLILLVLLWRGASQRFLVGFAIAGIGVSAGWRFFLEHAGASDARLRFATDTRADVLLVGCALGLIATGNMLPSRKWSKRLLVALGAAAAAAIAWFMATGKGPLLQALGTLEEATTTLFAVATAVAVASLLVAPGGVLARVLGWRVLTGVGRVSYGVYLWHYFLFIQLQQLLPGNAAVASATALAATGVAATVSYYAVEVPFLRLKARFSPATGQAARPAAPAAAPSTALAKLRAMESSSPSLAPLPSLVAVVLVGVPAILAVGAWGIPASTVPLPSAAAMESADLAALPPVALAPGEQVKVSLVKANNRTAGSAGLNQIKLHRAAINLRVRSVKPGPYVVRIHDIGSCDGKPETGKAFTTSGEPLVVEPPDNETDAPVALSAKADNGAAPGIVGTFVVDQAQKGELGTAIDGLRLDDLRDRDGSSLLIFPSPATDEKGRDDRLGTAMLCGVIFPPVLTAPPAAPSDDPTS